ncbi:MAG TPA: hypothetical protein VMV77_05485 [Bacteroidales bacterium]|nr:hypothetical protein [Bacteroidales bacterium]
MKRKKILKVAAIIIVAGIVIGGGIGLYMFNMPQRNVQAAKADYTLTGSQIVAEYLAGKEDANKKYLSGDGNSKILEVTGIINKISDDFNGQKVVLLKETGDKAGVSASFTAETSHNAEDLQIGSTVTIKGVIRSGASYDDDLELYENVILEKSDIVKK